MFYRACVECAAVHRTEEGAAHPWQCARCFCFQAGAAFTQEQFDRYAAKTAIRLVDPEKDELCYAFRHVKAGDFVFPVFKADEATATVDCPYCKRPHRYARPKDTTVVYVAEPVEVAA